MSRVTRLTNLQLCSYFQTKIKKNLLSGYKIKIFHILYHFSSRSQNIGKLQADCFLWKWRPLWNWLLVLTAELKLQTSQPVSQQRKKKGTSLKCFFNIIFCPWLCLFDSTIMQHIGRNHFSKRISLEKTSWIITIKAAHLKSLHCNCSHYGAETSSGEKIGTDFNATRTPKLKRDDTAMKW